MITASQIIDQTLESLAYPEDDEELYNHLYSILGRWSDFQDVQQVELSFIKRHFPSTSFSGKGYRFISIGHSTAKDEGIFPTISDAINLTNLSLTSLRRRVLDHKTKGRGRHCSWSKSIRGLMYEIHNMQSHITTERSRNLYLFSANVSGIDLGEAAFILSKLSHIVGREPDQLIGNYSDMTVDRIVGDFLNNQEVLAPMPNDINLIGIYANKEFYKISDLQKIESPEQRDVPKYLISATAGLILSHYKSSEDPRVAQREFQITRELKKYGLNYFQIYSLMEHELGMEWVTYWKENIKKVEQLVIKAIKEIREKE
jgi:hypothetical protein